MRFRLTMSAQILRRVTSVVCPFEARSIFRGVSVHCENYRSASITNLIRDGGFLGNLKKVEIEDIYIYT